MVSARSNPDRLRLHANVVDAAADARVERVVSTSFLGGPEAPSPWGGPLATEELLWGSGLGHTILRDPLYLDFLPLLSG
jgi:NAD(P)H dehydrogenase (quinone)